MMLHSVFEGPFLVAEHNPCASVSMAYHMLWCMVVMSGCWVLSKGDTEGKV